MLLLQRASTEGLSGHLHEVHNVNSATGTIPYVPYAVVPAFAAPYPSMDVAHVRLNARYTPIQLLGAGNYGTVYLAYDQFEQEIVAVKVLSPQNYFTRYIEDELVHHNLLNEHPHIIKFREVFLTDDQKLCLAMEYADGGTLYSFVRSRTTLSESLARRFFQQLILAVTYCHRRHIAVRDIKLENILLAGSPDSNNPASDFHWLAKLCDFGFSKQSDARTGNDMASVVGTLAYMAPEVIQSNFQRQLYNGYAADMWSCGVVLFYMLYGTYPFNYDHIVGQEAPLAMDALLTNMLNQALYPISDVDVSDGAYSLIRALLNPRPRGRASLSKVYADPWFQQGLPSSVHEFNNNPALIGQGPVQPEEVVRGAVAHARLCHQHLAQGAPV